MEECLRIPQPKSQKYVPMCSNAKLQKVDLHEVSWSVTSASPRAILKRSWRVVLNRNKVTYVARYSNCVQAATSAPTAKLLCKFVSILITCPDHEDTYITRLCRSVHLWELVSEIRSIKKIAWEMSTCNCLLLIYSSKRASWDWCQAQLLNE